MEEKHNHIHPTGTRNLRTAFWLNTAFAVLELAGGLFINSVAILSNALHDFGDSLSLGLAHYFEKKSKKHRDKVFSYGYKRFSLLGAFINSLILILGSFFVIQEALKRLAKPEQANARGMLLLAVIGITVNTIAMLRLRKSNSVNERVVSLHFLEDILGWVAVLLGSVVMMFADVPLLDPALSILISVFILVNVYKNLRYVFRIILQGIPEDINIDEINKKIVAISGILAIHDVHTWTLDGQYNIMTLHIVLKQQTSMTEITRIKQEVRHCLEHLNIQHLTIETEWEDQPCELIDC